MNTHAMTVKKFIYSIYRGKKKYTFIGRTLIILLLLAIALMAATVTFYEHLPLSARSYLMWLGHFTGFTGKYTRQELLQVAEIMAQLYWVAGLLLIGYMHFLFSAKPILTLYGRFFMVSSPPGLPKGGSWVRVFEKKAPVVCPPAEPQATPTPFAVKTTAYHYPAYDTKIEGHKQTANLKLYLKHQDDLFYSRLVQGQIAEAPPAVAELVPAVMEIVGQG